MGHALLLPLIAGTAVGAVASKILKPKEQEMPAIPEPPKAPESPKEATKQFARSADEAKRKAAMMAGVFNTNKTSPLGLTTPASTSKKTLLGQ